MELDRREKKEKKDRADRWQQLGESRADRKVSLRRVQKERARKDEIAQLQREANYLREKGTQRTKIRSLKSEIRRSKLGLKPKTQSGKGKGSRGSAVGKSLLRGMANFAGNLNASYAQPPATPGKKGKAKRDQFDYW